jgi:nicotinamide mononucleotide transporter
MNNLVEIVAAIFSLLSVVFAVKNNILTWPTALIGVTFYSIFFYQNHIWGNMFLQILFFIQSIYGWSKWDMIDNTKVEWLEKHDKNIIALSSFLLTIFITFILLMTGDKSPYFDGITTSLSLIAVTLLAKKKIDTWFYWIIVDVLFVAFFLIEGNYLSSVTYFVFLILAITGLKKWKKLQINPNL